MTESVPMDTAELAGRRWSFGPAVLDERSLELLVGGELVPLERKPLEVLLYLLHHSGEVVTKDDLAESLWPGRILTETVLTRCISVLRQALRDDAKTLIRTVHGYGYRLVADVRVEASGTTTPPAFDFKVGDHPPLRPQWKLVERLGTGGHGEAWLARHEKTGDARVFKFALDAGALTSLKREITLYRLLHDSLGARAAIARIYEWNLSEPPYFIEMEYVGGGNLQAWLDTQGGIAEVSLNARLELAAQIADALAAAHSVGALHKDLKPGNVLIHTNGGQPTVRLSDFGCGGVLDPKRLEELGITRLGFTKTMADGNDAGTPLYLAPEVVTGQPFTVQSDIYALGVLLYQLVTGNLRKALAPGWESDVADELLREDIAAAAAGNPARRLTDAAQLAERLRTLEVRREARAAEAAARQRAERAKRIQDELRRTRMYAAALLLLACIAIAGGVTAYRARNEAVLATADATAISRFLMEGVFWVDNSVDSPRVDTYEASLDRAATQVDEHFVGKPEAAATIHWLLGRRYEEIELISSAAKQYEAAYAIYRHLNGPYAHKALLARERIASILVDHEGRDQAAELIRELRMHWKSAPQNEIVTLIWRTRIAKLLLLAGDLVGAEKDLTEVVNYARDANTLNETATALFKQWFGYAPRDLDAARTTLSANANDLLSVRHGEFGDQYEQAEVLARRALELFLQVSGEDSEPAATARLRLGSVLMYRGKYDEAEPTLLHARTFFEKSLPETHAVRGISDFWIARVRLGQRRPAEALELFRESYRRCGDKCPARRRYACLTGIGDAYVDLAQWDAAIQHYRMALSARDSIKGPTNILQYSAHVGLATAMWHTGKLHEALEVLTAIDERIIHEYPHHTFRASYLRTKGLLANAAKQHETAITALGESARIQAEVLGERHWRTVRTRRELAEILATRPK